MEPPRHAASAPVPSPQPRGRVVSSRCTLSSGDNVSGRAARKSFSTRSAKPGRREFPPVNSTCPTAGSRRSTGSAMIACSMASTIPPCSKPISEGLKRSSGTVNRSMFKLISCSGPRSSGSSCVARASFHTREESPRT